MSSEADGGSGEDMKLRHQRSIVLGVLRSTEGVPCSTLFVLCVYDRECPAYAIDRVPLLFTEECLSRALYCLEMAWHPSFDPASGTNCRLDFEVEENRPFFVALFRHIQVWRVWMVWGVGDGLM